MFKLFATIYFLMNGQSVGDPMKIPNNHVFANMEECSGFISTDLGERSLAQLNAEIDLNSPPGASHTVTTSCEPVKGDTI